jgi:hypothetical protein
MRTPHRALGSLCALLVVAAACGGPSRAGEKSSARELTPAESRFPALALVPADAPYALVAARTGDLAQAIAEMVELAGIPLEVDFRATRAMLVSIFGLNPLDPAALASAGIAVDQSGGIFGAGLFPTLVLPVADEAQLRAHLDERRPGQDMSVSRHAGHEVYAWRPERGELEVAWVITGGWLLVHAAIPVARQAAGREAGHAWLSAALAAREAGGLGAHPEMDAALARATSALGGAAPGIVGLLRVPELAGAARAAASEAGAPWLASALDRCDRVAAASGGRIYLGGTIAWDGVVGVAALDLEPGAAAALSRNRSRPAPAGYYGFREESALSVDVAVDLAWLERARAAAGCPLFDRPIVDPLAAALGGGIRSYHLAARDLDVERLAGHLALYLTLTDRRGIARQLDQIPGRSWLERKRTIAGTEVRVLGGIPGLPSFSYRLTDADFTAAIGDGVMERVLGEAAPGAGADELFALALSPGRLPGLPGLLEMALQNLEGRGSREAARALAGRLGRYESLTARASLDGDSLLLRATVRLRK